MNVPYLSKAEIIQAANAVLTLHREKTGRPVKPPIPVEEIISMMGLRCQFVDFEHIGSPDVLGATYVKKRLIAVNSRLLEDGSAGRAAFTQAHEAGHWVLHRRLLAVPGGHEEETIFCRSKDAGKPIEWQADYFAGCLLMPENLVRTTFKETFAPEMIEIINEKKNFSSMPYCFDFCVENWPYIADAVRTAGGFDNVSCQAMIIRLQELGLVINHTRRKMGWEKRSSVVPAG